MPFLNKCMLIGNVGKDPEIKTLQSGKTFASFSLATSKRYKDNNGEQKEQTTWHNIVVWGKLADVIEQLNVAKGTSLYVEGEITTRSWDDPTTGQKRYTTEINASSFQILTPRGTGSNGNSAPAYNYAQGKPSETTNQQQASGFQSSEEDDLPF